MSEIAFLISWAYFRYILPSLLNVHNVIDVRQEEVHTAEPLVPVPGHVEVEIAFAKLKKYKSLGSNKILAELIEAGGETVTVCDPQSLILFGVRNNCLIKGRDLLLNQFTKRVIKLTVIIVEIYRCYQLHTKFYRISECRTYMKLLGIISVGFDVTD
jgi:hypothetical protein